jgi:hypothetical protein
MPLIQIKIEVSSVGIHEGSAHEKIFTNSLAHIMNDETTKKVFAVCEEAHYILPEEVPHRSIKVG